MQLTGFSDPVYAEAYVNVNQYDIVLDVLVVNQTPDTLQGLCMELATLGDLKLVEKPMACTVGPHDFVNIKVSCSDQVVGMLRCCVIFRLVSKYPLLRMESFLGILVSEGGILL